VVKGEQKGHWSGWIKVGLDSSTIPTKEAYALCLKGVKLARLISY